MLDESTLLLHAVLDNPDDDTPRSMLADWLQEYGETEFHRWYGRFIACQLAGKSWLDMNENPFWSDTLIGHASVHIKAHTLKVDGELIHRRVESGLPPITFEVVRGFIRAVDITMGDFLRLAIVLFKRHPIQEVRIRGFGFGRLYGKLRIYVNNLPSTQVSRDGVYYLPVGFKSLLNGGNLTYNDGYGDRDYTGETEALADLSQACVAFGRMHAKGIREGKEVPATL